MRTIVAGSRSVDDYSTVSKAIESAPFRPTVIVSGDAPGVDTLGALFGTKHNIPVEHFPADWDNLNVTPCKIRRDKRGNPYNVLAGMIRNERMANNAEALIAIWDGISKGTKNMIETARKKGLTVYISTTVQTKIA